MGFDLGALLRGGAAGMAGYTEGQIERKKREEEARRAALSEALMQAQFANYSSLAQDRLAGQEQTRVTAERLRQEREDKKRTQKQQADWFRSQFPRELGGTSDDAAAVARGVDLLTQQQAIERDRLNSQNIQGRQVPRENDDTIFGRLRAEWDEAHRNEMAGIQNDPMKRLNVALGGSALTAADTTRMLQGVGQEVAEATPEQVQRFQQSIQPTEDTAAIQALTQQNNEADQQLAEALQRLEQLEQQLTRRP